MIHVYTKKHVDFIISSICYIHINSLNCLYAKVIRARQGL